MSVVRNTIVYDALSKTGVLSLMSPMLITTVATVCSREGAEGRLAVIVKLNRGVSSLSTICKTFITPLFWSSSKNPNSLPPVIVYTNSSGVGDTCSTATLPTVVF